MNAAPTGTVTFLFTDIEGSTRLWEEHPDAMRLALARHDSLLRSAIETEGGYIFKTVGDAFCAAFSTVRQAVSAAIRIQELLGTMRPSTRTQVAALSLKVRIGLHTGAAEARDGDYFGPPLNRLARLLAAGHGGQVLLSEATHALARHDLPLQTAVRDLGIHHLRDLGAPEHVFQLLHPVLQDDFPRLRSLDALPNNLPHQLTSFVGRRTEMAEARSLLERSRLLTLIGAGGTGKTRLSIQLAAEVLDEYPDGVWLVELAPLNDGELVGPTVADTLGVREPGEIGGAKGLAAALREKRLLLVLDNCEHLLNAAAHLVEHLMVACPQVRVVATSREALGIPGEQSYRVPCLSLPRNDGLSVEVLSQFEAVRLFLERATLADVRFRMTDETAPFIVRICRRLDGIPLALELAAARVGALSVEMLADRLDHSFRILTGGSRTALPQHRTLHALIDWSYGLLSEPEQLLLRRLAVFSGGWTVEAAETICAGGPVEEWEVLNLLVRLVEKSLVASDLAGTRHHLLETVREFAWARAMEAGEGADLRNRHRDQFLRLAEEAEPHLTSSDLVVWLDRLEREKDNLRTALEWCVDHPEEGEMASALWRFWGSRGYATEGRDHLRRALARAFEPAHRAKVLNAAGMLARIQCDYAEAELSLRESLEIWTRLGQQREIAAALNNLGLVAHEQRDYLAARSLHEDSLRIRRDLKDDWGIGVSLNNLGCVMDDEGDLDAAWDLYSAALVSIQRVGARDFEARAVTNLAAIAVKCGRYPEARSLAVAGARIVHQLGDQPGIIHCLETLANLALVEEDAIRAVQLLASVERIREVIGSPGAPCEQESQLADVARARTQLGESQFAAAWRHGTALSTDEAVAFAINDDPLPGATAASPQPQNHSTPSQAYGSA